MKNNSYAPARKEGGWKPTVLFWIVAAVVLLLVLLFALAGGLGVALFILGLIVLLTGLYALLFKRPSWVGLPHRRSGGLVAIAGFVVFALGLGVTGATATPRADSKTAAAEVNTPKPSATKTATPTPTASNPANSACTTAAATQKYNSQTLVCTADVDQHLVWMTEADSKKVMAEKAAAEKASAEKVAAELAAAEKAAAEKAAAEQVAAAQAAAEQAARDAAARPAPQVPAAPAPVVPAPAVPAPAVPAPVVPAPAPAPAPAAAPFANCTAARAAGAAPVYAGTPGYGKHLDRDGDGIGCDK